MGWLISMTCSACKAFKSCRQHGRTPRFLVVGMKDLAGRLMVGSKTVTMDVGPIDEPTDAEMQRVAFAAKMALAKEMRARKRKHTGRAKR